MSHITSNTHSSLEGKLPTDIASDRHTSFHTALQMITRQGSKPIPVKVDPGMDVNTIPLSKYRKLFPAHFTNAGNLKQKSLHPTRHMWTAHHDIQHFLGFFIADIHHKTQPEILPVRFYVFKDTTSPKILLSYAALERLGIVKFQMPNEVPSTALDTISSRKYIAFRTPLHRYRPINPRNNGQQPLKPAIKIHAFQDHSLQEQSLQDNLLQTIPLLQDHSSQKQSFQDHSPQSVPISQDHFTTANVCDIITIKKAFPQVF